MKLSNWLAGMIHGMPDGGSIILPVETVKERLKVNGSGLDADLTVAEVGKFFNRSPITIRSWIREGRLEAYLFQGREYRVRGSALEEFQQNERGRGRQQ